MMGDWLSRLDKDAKETRDRKIGELWFSCHTNKEIAETVDLTEEGVLQITQEMTDLLKLGNSSQSAASHAIRPANLKYLETANPEPQKSIRPDVIAGLILSNNDRELLMTAVTAAGYHETVCRVFQGTAN